MHMPEASSTQAADISDWTLLDACPEMARPPAPWPWLAHAGSLTQKLRDHAGAAFHVRVLRETGVRLEAEDARLLGLRIGTPARLREVYLCGLEPLVFARTLAADEGAAHWLKQLGARPLGERVFAEHDTLRGGIEVAHLPVTAALCGTALRDLDVPVVPLWARRSVLTVRKAKLLIYECFLPGAGD